MNCIHCNKECKNSNSLNNHQRLCRDNPNRQISSVEKANKIAINCKYCNKTFTRNSVKRHERACFDNADNHKECPVCGIMFAGGSITCSYACSNTHFRSGVNNPNFKSQGYRQICFRHHGKKCLVCGETKIVAAHHVNLNHFDNRPENLVPLCPTHHQYIHSRYIDEVLPIVNNYLENYLRV